MTTFQPGDLVRVLTGDGKRYAGRIAFLYAYNTIARLEVTEVGNSPWSVDQVVDVGVVRLTAYEEEEK